MLRGNSQARVQVHQWLDAALFAIGLYAAHFLRARWQISFRADKIADPIAPFVDYFWLFLLVIPMSWIALEGAGVNTSSRIFAPPRAKAWQLAKACFICAIGLVLLMYLRRRNCGARRGGPLWVFQLRAGVAEGRIGAVGAPKPVGAGALLEAGGAGGGGLGNQQPAHGHAEDAPGIAGGRGV